MRLGVCCVVLCACGFRHGVGSDAAVTHDAIDAPVGQQVCVGDASFAGGPICVRPGAGRDFSTDTTLHSGDGSAVMGDCDLKRAQPTGRMLCVIAATSLTIDGGVTVTVVDADPVAFVVTGDLTIAGTLDVSSSRSGQRHGAGANDAACDSSTIDGTDSGDSGGGGAGGSFGSVGGNGGAGDNTAVPGGAATAAVAAPTFLRGGCSGGAGGDGTGGTTHAMPGDGGGAIYLDAKGTITISGTVDASGAAGLRGGTNIGGGGGAGSGGMIALYAMTIDTTGASIFANGAGGGGGGNSTSGSSGSEPTAPTSPAFGGGGANGGDGGTGAYDTMSASRGGNGGSNGANTCGGGGGGGGIGVIRVLSGQSLGGSVSPSPSG
jgi:hypothetical protein